MEQEPKTPRERAEDLISQLVPDWRPSQQQVLLWTVRIVVALVALYVLIRISYALQWTGFGQTEVKKGVQPSKTLWDWMDLLIVPVVLAIGGYLFTRSESRATQAAAERQNRATQVAADRRAQDEALQAYLDQMSAMLLDKDRPLRQSKADADVRTLARARTLTVLPRLAGDGKGRVVQFLRESNVISRARAEQGEDAKVVDLSGANLTDANLFGLNLRGVALDGVILEQASLRFAQLPDADLGRSSLSSANLEHANLSRANLSNAILWRANLSRADISGANLSGANLPSALLSRAYPSIAKELTQEQLDQAPSLKGATMPNGQKYEDWRGSIDRGEDGENSGP
jgi:uncharacterized protein YjbI with pentapeptide repeats